MDLDLEIKKISKKIDSELKFLNASKVKLKNPGFLNNAKKNIIIELQEKIRISEKKVIALKKQNLEIKK